MPKSTKAVVSVRIGEVLRLLLAGAEFDDIWKYSQQHGWKVSQRQVRRYIESAYEQMAEWAWRNRQQLLGRHLMQRRALYARTMKEGDHRTALRVLQDEAALEGLYPTAQASTSALVGQSSGAGSDAPALSRRQRVVRLLAAEANEDDVDRRLMKQITPTRTHWLPDTQLPIQMLNMLAMIHVAGQLDVAALLLSSKESSLMDQGTDEDCELLRTMTAHRFRLGQEAWHRFCHGLGVDGDRLVENNQPSLFLTLHTDKICQLAPTPQQLESALAQLGMTSEKVVSLDQLVRRWRRLFDRICPN